MLVEQLLYTQYGQNWGEHFAHVFAHVFAYVFIFSVFKYLDIHAIQN